MSQLKIVVNVSKGSPLTGNAWVDILFGGIREVEHAEVKSAFDINNSTPLDAIEFTVDYDETLHNTITVLNTPETIGPIQIYHLDFFIDGVEAQLTWQTAIKNKPLRFGGETSQVITNPHIDNPEFCGWCSIPNVSPGMSITWPIADLIRVTAN